MAKRIQRKRTSGYRGDYKRQWLKSEDRPRALCHPDKPHRARGLCDPCYNRWLYANSLRNQTSKKASNEKWRKANADKVKAGQRDQKLRKKYGITTDDYNRMYLAQNGQCGICKQNGITLHVDHNHETGAVRALLCLPCNGLLAFVERLLRNDAWMVLASEYLETRRA